MPICRRGKGHRRRGRPGRGGEGGVLEEGKKKKNLKGVVKIEGINDIPDI